MSEHDEEYRSQLSKVQRSDRLSMEAHLELGLLFDKYGEPIAEIAEAIGRGVTYVADHLMIARTIRTPEALAVILDDRDDIQSWTVLLDWVRAGGPGQEADDDPDAPEISRRRRQGPGRPGETGGLQLLVPAYIIKGLADAGCNPREVMRNFWVNVSPHLLISVAYPDRQQREDVA